MQGPLPVRWLHVSSLLLRQALCNMYNNYSRWRVQLNLTMHAVANSVLQASRLHDMHTVSGKHLNTPPSHGKFM
jgi:Zn-dependent membrane protease YugP